MSYIFTRWFCHKPDEGFPMEFSEEKATSYFNKFKKTMKVAADSEDDAHLIKIAVSDGDTVLNTFQLQCAHMKP